MVKTFISIYLVFCLACLVRVSGTQAQAVSGSVSQPVLTYIDDDAHHLRPLVGISGAASIGNAIDLGFEVAQAAVPPTHDYVLAMAAGSNWPILVQVNGGTMIPQFNAFAANQANCNTTDASDIRQVRPNCLTVPAIDAGTVIDRVALSPSGSAAALLSSRSGRVYRFTNLSQTPAPGHPIDVSTLGPVTSFGISDDGQTVAIGVSGGLFLSSYGAQPWLAASISHPAAIAFLHSSADAVIADDVQNTIYSLSGGQVFPVASAGDGISTPVAIGISNDNQRIFVANAQSNSIATISPAGSAAAPLSCNCSLTGLFPTNTDSVFRLTDFTGKPVLLFDASRQMPRITFVPLNGSQF